MSNLEEPLRFFFPYSVSNRVGTVRANATTYISDFMPLLTAVLQFCFRRTLPTYIVIQRFIVL